MKAHNSSPRNTAIYLAIIKYGWDAFKKEILIKGLTLEEANKAETSLILQKQSLAPNGYNLNTGGDKKLPSEETKKKMSESAKKVKRRPLSDVTKARISASEKGKKVSEETRMKLSEAAKALCMEDQDKIKKLCEAAKLVNTGKKRPLGLMKKLQEHNTGRKNSKETKLKMSLAAKGRTAHNKGKPWSEETKLKMSEAAKRRWRQEV
jgi:hypothetical protein